jgi:Flp pilus assembly protein TadG
MIARMGRRTRGRPAAGGQAIVEFAVVSVAFFMLVFGTIDFGRAIYVDSQLENAVRDAAREGKVGFTNGTGVSTARLKDHVKNYWNPETQTTRARPGLANVAVTVTCSGACTTGDALTIAATLPFQAVTQDLLDTSDGCGGANGGRGWSSSRSRCPSCSC